MRIIAGSKKGMKLFSPKTYSSRPITDRVKESLFSVLYKYDLPMDKLTADLFCGVGSFGLESLSRGARCVTFVEQDLQTLNILKKNIDKAGWVEQSKVRRGNAFRIGAPVICEKYELVFIDPPYAATEDISKTSQLAGLFVILSKQVSTGGHVIVRTHKNIQPLDNYAEFAMVEKRRWSTMNITIFKQCSDDK